jgi:type I restriction enzyme S subunit
MGHIQRHHLSEALTVIPPENILQAMDKTMMPLIEKTIANSLESSQLSTFRDFLLPKLMSGEIRVKEAEKMVGNVA